MWTPAGKVKLVGSQNAPSFRPGSSSWPLNLCAGIGVQRDRAEVDRLVGALDRELAVLELDVPFGGLEHVARDLLRLGLDLVERLGDRRHADRAGARAVGAHAHLHLVGVAVDDRHIFHRDAEPTGDELGEGRFVALPVTVRAGQDLDRADHVDAHFRRFPEADAAAERADRRRWRDAAGFDIGGESDAAKLALRGRGGLARREALVVGLLPAPYRGRPESRRRHSSSEPASGAGKS